MDTRLALALCGSLAFAAPLAAQPVAVANSVYVEREIAAPSGRAVRTLEPATALRRGDRVVYFLSWRAPQPERFTITNPLPRSVAYERSAGGLEEVSVDGGRTWGRIDTLKVRDGTRWRNATPEDVTHVRFQVPARLALAGSGRLTWSGIVR